MAGKAEKERRSPIGSRNYCRPSADRQFRRRRLAASDVQCLPVLGDAAHHDMDARVAGVVVIDRDSIERRAEIFLHPRHHVARERLRVFIGRAVLGR